MTASLPRSPSSALPNPGQASTLDELIERLRALRIWSGSPSYAAITDRVNAVWKAAGRPAGDLTRKSTVVDCFKSGRRRINTDLVIAVVGVLHPDAGYVAQWLQALRVVRGEAPPSTQIRVQETLPEDLPQFTGRAAELNEIRKALHSPQLDGDAVVISALAGMAGVGKTRLAVHAAHTLVRQQKFDRVLFVDLRGFHPDPAQPPADPAAVLDGFLRLLGVAGHQIPLDLAARAATYRDRLAGIRALVILDNAADAEQVRPLVAATPGCLTLVTSRRSLTELNRAVHLSVDVFSPHEALGFLANAVPEVPAGADQQAAARIANRCGHLPLALSLVAGHIRSTSGWTLTDHADRLEERHHHRPLDSGIELAFDLSYQHLPADQQRLLRLGALHPGQDIDAYAAAAVLDTDLATAEDLLHHLRRDHLLLQPAAGRFSFHDLVRAYAAGRSRDQDAPPQRRAALSRLFDYYLATAAAAMNVAYASERHRRPTVAPARTAAPSFTDSHHADQWLDTELANLLAAAQHAAEHGWPEHTWQLSATLSRHLRTRGRHRDAETLHQHALHLARHLHNRHAEVNALNCLGHMDRMLGRHERSSDRFERASQIARSISDRAGELAALAGLGYACWLAGSYEQSGGYFEQALKIAQDIGDRTGERLALASLGDVHRVMGDPVQAHECLAQALHIAQDLGDRVGELYALTSLGSVQLILHDNGLAGSHYAKAWQIAQDIGDRIGELTSLIGLGHVHLALDLHSDAVGYYQQGLDLARELHSKNWQFEAFQGLGRTHLAAGRPALSLDHHGQALEFATQLAQVPDQARAHDGLAHAYHALHQYDHARLHWRYALDLLTALGIDRTEEAQTSVTNIRAHLSRQLPA